MPMTILRNSRQPGKESELKGATFTGDVWADPIYVNPSDGANMNNMMFTPSARTHWHEHEFGCVLLVNAGSGWVCDRGGKPEKLSVGDIVWAPPGTVHWHGADEHSYMLHHAISFGKTTWFEAVNDAQYNERNSK